MPTPGITLFVFVVAVVFVAALFVLAIWQHRIALAFAWAGLASIIAYLGFMLMAWSSLVTYGHAMDTYERQLDGNTLMLRPSFPTWATFAEWQYNLFALTGIVLLTVAAAIVTVGRVRTTLADREDRARLERVPSESRPFNAFTD